MIGEMERYWVAGAIGAGGCRHERLILGIATDPDCCPWVFHRRGKPTKGYYTGWRNACLAARFATRDPKTNRIQTSRIPHDFRRTAVRNLVIAGRPKRRPCK
jgi:hypothetical protein